MKGEYIGLALITVVLIPCLVFLGYAVTRLVIWAIQENRTVLKPFMVGDVVEVISQDSCFHTWQGKVREVGDGDWGGFVWIVFERETATPPQLFHIRDLTLIGQDED